MPQSLANILIHLIWSTKGRHPWLEPGIREKTHCIDYDERYVWD
jgi:hypothetical protein